MICLLSSTKAVLLISQFEIKFVQLLTCDYSKVRVGNWKNERPFYSFLTHKRAFKRCREPSWRALCFLFFQMFARTVSKESWKNRKWERLNGSLSIWTEVTERTLGCFTSYIVRWVSSHPAFQDSPAGQEMLTHLLDCDPTAQTLSTLEGGEVISDRITISEHLGPNRTDWRMPRG